MSSNKIDMPMIRNTDRREGQRNGGIQVYWLAEAAQKTSSRPRFGKVGLELNEMAGLVFVTNTLLEDSPVSLEPLLGEMFAEEFALVLDDRIIRGTGVGNPLGVLNAPATIVQPIEAGQAPGTILAENILNMWGRMWGGSLGTSVWLYNTECLQQLMTMFIPMGVNSLPLWMPPTGLSGSPYGTILGRPAIPMEQCSGLGAVGDIAFCDFSYYLLGQKSKSIEATTSIHLRFDYDETAFRYVMRVDGQPWLDGPITPMQGTVTKSPFVVLAAR
jgi:HK97 family phage major capsid protein